MLFLICEKENFLVKLGSGCASECEHLKVERDRISLEVH